MSPEASGLSGLPAIAGEASSPRSRAADLGARLDAKVDPAARGLDALDADAQRVADAHGAALVAEEDRGLLVEIPPAARDAAHGQEALVRPRIALAERDERARADEPDDLAPERLVPAASDQFALQQEAARDVVRRALDQHR